MITNQDIEIILGFTMTEFKLRFRNAYFGYIWSILNPLLMLSTLYIIFSYVVKLEIPNYRLFLLIGIISWNFFSDATTKSLNFLIGNSSLLLRHKLSPAIFVVSSCLSSFIIYLLNFFVFIALAAFLGLKFNILNFISIFYILLLFFFSLGISMILVVIYSYFKDIIHIWSFLLLIGFWISPIIYSELVIPIELRGVYMLNPIARIIIHMRNLFIYSYLDTFSQCVITFILVILTLYIGFALLSRFNSGFGERL